MTSPGRNFRHQLRFSSPCGPPFLLSVPLVVRDGGQRYQHPFSGFRFTTAVQLGHNCSSLNPRSLPKGGGGQIRGNLRYQTTMNRIPLKRPIPSLCWADRSKMTSWKTTVLYIIPGIQWEQVSRRAMQKPDALLWCLDGYEDDPQHRNEMGVNEDCCKATESQENKQFAKHKFKDRTID